MTDTATEPVNEKNELTQADLILLLEVGTLSANYYFLPPGTVDRWKAALKHLTRENEKQKPI